MNRFFKKMPKVADGAYKSAPESLCNKINAPLIALLFLILPIQVAAQNHTDDLVFGDTLTSGQINKFGDHSVENALGRFAGVQMNREGKINIRGLGYTSYYVTIDGQRLANSGFGDRSFDLRSISADMIEELQLIKILSPDMDADAISGVINMSLRKDMVDGRFLEITAGGGLNPHYIDHTNAANRFLVKYAERFSENFSISLNLNYQKETNAWDQLIFNYGQFDFGNGFVSVPEQVAPGFQTREMSRLGANLVLNYQPSAQNNYYLQGMVNSSTELRNVHVNNWLANETWISPTTTGNQASLLYDFQTEDNNIQQFIFQAGGENQLNGFNIKYQLGWAQNNTSKNYYRLPFALNSIEYSLDLKDVRKPVIQMSDEDYSAQDLTLQTMNYVFDNHLHTRYTAKVDVEIPVSSGYIQLGASTALSVKDALDRGAYSNYNYDYRGVLNLSGFDKTTDAETIDLFGEKYHLPWLVDSKNAVSFFDTSIPNMRLDNSLLNRNSDIWNYKANEHIYALYAMSGLDFGNLNVTGGLRAEYTSAEYTGRNVAFNRFDLYEITTEISEENDFWHLFPNAQIYLSVTDNTLIGLAYSRSASRPHFNMLAPFELATPVDTSFFRGNPNLKPVISDNLDLLLEQRYSNTGSVTAGMFYKRLNNHFIYSEQQTEMLEGDNIYFDNFFNNATTIPATVNSFRNSAETSGIYGIELTWHQQLNFLPGIFRNLSLFTNYTWSHTDYKADNDADISFIHLSPHIVNAALSYNSNKLSAQVSYHWTSEITNRELDDHRKISVLTSNNLYREYYQQGRQNLSAAVSYNITNRFQIWANANNLISIDRLEYADDSDLYPLSIYHRQGFELMMGLTFTL